MADDPVHTLLEQCCLQLRSAAGVGSGFFVAPKTVVTCAHVLGKGATVGSSAELRPGGQGGWLPARVTAIEPADEDDLAVLEVDAHADTYPVLDADDDVTYDDELLIFGFPRFSPKEPQRAVLLPARYEATTGLTHLPDRVLHKFQSGRVVGGYSGCPALDVATGKVIGVVSETIDPKAEAGGWAVRSAFLAKTFSDVAAKNRNAASLQRWLDRIDTRQERRETRSRRLPRLPLTQYLERRVSAPTELDYLNPYARVTAFIGRQLELSVIQQWLDSEQPISIAVWIGPPRSGKTRLALEAIERAVAAGWHAGFIECDALKRFHQQYPNWTWQRRTFIVVDRAADHAALIATWLARLAETTVLLRIMLLERHANPESGWWQTVFQGPADLGSLAVRRRLNHDSPVFLSPLPLLYGNSAFESAISDRSWTGESPRTAKIPRENVTSVPCLRHTYLHELAIMERARVMTVAEAKRVEPGFLIHMAAYVALCQGLQRDAVLDAVATERAALYHGSDDTDTARVTGALEHAFPGSDAVAAVDADILGAFVLTAFRSPRDDEVILRASMHSPVDVATTVIRIGQDYVDTERLGDAQCWFRKIIQHNDLSLPQLIQIINQLPSPTVAFSDDAAWLADIIVRKLRTIHE